MRTRLLLVLLTLLAGAAGAEEVRHAVGQVQVLGGHPIREVAKGVIFLQSFNEDCVLVPPRPGFTDLPFAGTRGTAVELEVDVAACPAADVAAPVACRWQVEPATPFDPSCGQPAVAPYGGSESFVGSLGRIEVRLPEETGRYDFSLECDAGGIATRLRSPLYVTFSTPHPMMTLLGATGVGKGPEAVWYRLACCWGAGFGAGAATDEILAAMKTGTYHFGQGNWRYGFGRRDAAPDHLLFKLHPGTEACYVIANPSFRPSCPGFFCLCSWQGVVDPASGCGFGNCKTFADALYFMAATLGVNGVIAPYNFTAPSPNGFIVSPGSVSLDPAFLANITARADAAAAGEPPGDRYRYFFTNHWLVQSCSDAAGTDCRYFDPTFDRIYDDPAELVGLISRPQTIECPAGRNCFTFKDSALVLAEMGLGYGSWSFFAQNHLPEAPPAGAAPALQPFSDADFEVDHEDRQGPAPTLTVRATLPRWLEEVPARAALLDAEGNAVANKPTWDATQETFGVAPRDGSRSGELLFFFSGEQIYRSRKDGPYTLAVYAADADGPAAFTATSRWAYDYREFGELGAELRHVGARVEPCTGGAGESCVRVEADLEVRRPGDYALALTLVSGSRPVALEAREFALERGPRTLEVELPAVPAAGEAAAVAVALFEVPYRWLAGATEGVVDGR